MPFPLSAVTLKEKRPRGNKKEKKKKATNCFTARKTKKGGSMPLLSPPLYFICHCAHVGKLAVFFLSLPAGKKKKAKELSCSGKKDEDEEKKDIFTCLVFL